MTHSAHMDFMNRLGMAGCSAMHEISAGAGSAEALSGAVVKYGGNRGNAARASQRNIRTESYPVTMVAPIPKMRLLHAPRSYG